MDLQYKKRVSLLNLPDELLLEILEYDSNMILIFTQINKKFNIFFNIFKNIIYIFIMKKQLNFYFTSKNNYFIYLFNILLKK